MRIITAVAVVCAAIIIAVLCIQVSDLSQRLQRQERMMQLQIELDKRIIEELASQRAARDV